MIKILFIGHDAYRAGAQILLLQFLKWLNVNRSDIQFEIMLGSGGTLLNEYKAIAPVNLYFRKSSKNKIRNRYKRYRQLEQLKYSKFDLIYSNSIVNGEILSSLESLKLPVISHIHELNYWINKSGELNLKYVKNFSSRYIVASEAVRRCLVVDYGFDNDIIESVSEFVLFENLQKRADKLSLKQKLNIPTNAIIVGASGAEDWRKGKDWFIPMAIDVLAITKNMNIHFVWIGGRLNDELEFDLDKSGIKDKVHFIEHLPEANRYFSEFSVFAMLSREDPFPVVNLEAAGLGVPIICFDNSGGTPELIANGCGFSVPYANLHDFAEKVVRLIEDNKLYFQMSEAGILAVKTKYDIDIIANKLVDIIYSVVDK